MIRRRQHELVVISKKERLQAVDQLRDVRCANFLRVPIKRIERQARQDRIANCRLLTQKMCVSCFCAGPVPRPPFIDDQFNAMRAIAFAHHDPLIRDQ